MLFQVWTYKGEEFIEPGDNYGFVYVITNLTNDRKYIGKKFFWTTKRKTVNKKKRKVKVESDWKNYWSSSEELKKDIKDLGESNFKREIIHLCKSKGVANYLEAKEQFLRTVLEDNEKWYNGIINCRVNKTHIKLL